MGRLSLRAKALLVLVPLLAVIFTALMYHSIGLVAYEWYVGCVFGANGTRTCQWDMGWEPDPCVTVAPPPGAPKLGAKSAILMHMFLMSLAFGFFTPLGAIAFHSMRDMLGLSPNVTKLVHGMLFSGAVLCSILGFVQAYYANGGGCGTSHFRSMHSWFGILVLVLYWAQGPSALVFLANTRLLKPGGYWRSEVRRYHIFVGVFAFLGGLASIVTGILAASGKLDPAAPTPSFWWPMARAGAVCMALAFVTAAALYEAKVSVTKAASKISGIPVEYTAPLIGGDAKPTVSRGELAKHNADGDHWLAVHGLVYDVSGFVGSHPGGAGLLLRYTGGVADAGFDQHHEEGILETLPSGTFKGWLVDAPGGPSTSTSTSTPPASGVSMVSTNGVRLEAAGGSGGSSQLATFLRKQHQPVVLGARFELSHDVTRFRFILPPDAPLLGLPIGQHLKIYAPASGLPTASVDGQWNGRDDLEKESAQIERKYTPTTSEEDVGFVDLVVKVYKGGVLERFADGGKMSQFLDSLKIGSQVHVSGPWGHIEYVAPGTFSVSGERLTCKAIGMMAGGTGITPMLQILAAVLKVCGLPPPHTLTPHTHPTSPPLPHAIATLCPCLKVPLSSWRRPRSRRTRRPYRCSTPTRPRTTSSCATI